MAPQLARIVAIFQFVRTASKYAASYPRQDNRIAHQSEMGHSLRSFSASWPTFVCCYSNSDQKWCVAANDAKCHKRALAGAVGMSVK